jgi:hypothetical protein
MKEKYFAITFILVALNCFSQKDNCEKFFVNEGKQSKKSVVFSDDKFLQTKFLFLFKDGARNLTISFKQKDKNYIIVQQYSDQTLSFKRDFILGTAIKIGILFEDNENYILSFKGAENSKELFGTDGIVSRGLNMSSNEAEIDSDFDRLLKTKRIIAIEIQNPFNSVDQNSTVRTEDMTEKQGAMITEVYNCFLDKLSGN